MADLISPTLPDLLLPSTQGGQVCLSQISGTTVIVIYPYTGRPDHPNPANWNDIPGAHGSTPQLQNYSARYEEFQMRHTKVFGLSQLSPEWQKDFVSRNQLRVPLLSDQNFAFANLLSLKRFATGGAEFLSRQTLIAKDGIVKHQRDNIVSPDADADEVLRMLA